MKVPLMGRTGMERHTRHQMSSGLLPRAIRGLHSRFSCRWILGCWMPGSGSPCRESRYNAEWYSYRNEIWQIWVGAAFIGENAAPCSPQSRRRQAPVSLRDPAVGLFMKVSVIGCGYVGLVTGLGFAGLGHEIHLTDIDQGKLDALARAVVPISEPGLDDLIRDHRDRVILHDTVNDAVQASDLSFLCVGTPVSPGGAMDLSQVASAATDVGKAIASKETLHAVIVKSTVLPGTTERIVIPLLEKESRRTGEKAFDVAVNPEFLQEGNAVHDFFHPDRIVIGSREGAAREMLNELFRPLEARCLHTDWRTAEMIKFANNAFLATKISFSNEVGRVCKQAGVDPFQVFLGIGMDRRINPAFFRCGLGFGGSCLPKDLRALIAWATDLGVDPVILRGVMARNEAQPAAMVDLLKEHVGDLAGKKIGILGLSFKPGTDDIRESRAIPVIRQVLSAGASVLAYDPRAMENFRRRFPQVRYADAAADVLDSDAVLIITEWPEFGELDYSGRTVIDGRGVGQARSTARIYEGVCW